MDEQIGWLTFGEDSAYSRCMNCKHAGGLSIIAVPVYKSQIPQGYSWVCSSAHCERVVVIAGINSPKLFFKSGAARMFFNDADPDQLLNEEMLEMVKQFWLNSTRRR